jgi:hypothetical protein
VELSNVLNDCAVRLVRRGATEDHPSRACAYYLRSHTPPDEVISLVENIRTRLLSNGVSVCETPDPNVDKLFEIDSKKLEEVILVKYGRSREEFEASGRMKVRVGRDVASIRAVYKLRRGRVPVSIRKAEHILATDNTGLARADRSFARQELDYRNAVSAVQTAQTLCTVLWLQAPAEADALNAKRLIAVAYAVVDPDPRLVDCFVKQVLDQRARTVISEEEAYILRSSVAAINLLQDLTLNDPDRFTSKTADEVLADLLRDKDEETQAALKEKDEEIEQLRKEAVRKSEEADNAYERVAVLESSVRRRVRRQVSALGYSLVVIAVAWLAYAVYCDVADASFFGASVSRWAYSVVAALIIVFGGSVLSFRKSIGRLLYKARCKRLGIEPGEY